jgi:hypothetical protein
MAFPAAERLRFGVLGQLQYVRDQVGEEVVEKEVERVLERATGSAMASDITPESGAAVVNSAENRMDGQS